MPQPLLWDHVSCISVLTWIFQKNRKEKLCHLQLLYMYQIHTWPYTEGTVRNSTINKHFISSKSYLSSFHIISFPFVCRELLAHKDKKSPSPLTNMHGNFSISVVELSKKGVSTKGLFLLSHSMLQFQEAALVALFYLFQKSSGVALYNCKR